MSEIIMGEEKFIPEQVIFINYNEPQNSTKIVYGGNTVTVDSYNPEYEDFSEVSRIAAIEKIKRLIKEQEEAIEILNEKVRMSQYQIQKGMTIVEHLEAAPDFKPKGLATPFENIE